MSVAYGSGLSAGGTVTIGGQQYPAGSWEAYYAGQKANAQGAGTAVGAGVTALQEAAGLPLLGSSSGSKTSSSTGGSIPQVPAPTGGSASLQGLQTATGAGGSNPTLAPVNNTAANAATFGAAKDQAGQTARGAITGLRDELAGRGMLGGGVEAAATERAVNNAGQFANDVTRQNAVTDSQQNEQNALANYNGGIAMRGQDLTAQQNAANNTLQVRAQDITQRGQDISIQQGQAAQQQAALQGLLSVLGSTSGFLY